MFVLNYEPRGGGISETYRAIELGSEGSHEYVDVVAVDSVLAPIGECAGRALRITLGQQCKLARERLGLSQRKLAKIMDRSPSWVRKYEGGDQYAPHYLIVALSEALSEPVGWFYGWGHGV